MLCARLGTTHAARRLGPVVAPRADRALSPRNRSNQRRTVDPRRDRRSGRVAEHRTAARRDVRHRRLDPQRLARALVRVDRHRMPEYVTSSAIARDFVSVARRRCKLDARRHDVCGRSLVRGAFFGLHTARCMYGFESRLWARLAHSKKWSRGGVWQLSEGRTLPMCQRAGSSPWAGALVRGDHKDLRVLSGIRKTREALAARRRCACSSGGDHAALAELPDPTT